MLGTRVAPYASRESRPIDQISPVFKRVDGLTPSGLEYPTNSVDPLSGVRGYSRPMPDHTPLQPTELRSGDADARNGGAPAEGTVGLSKPRRRSPAKSRQTKAKRAGGKDEQARGGRPDLAKGTAESESPAGWVSVSASDLLERVGELTEQLTRARVGLETLRGERDALSAELETERRNHGDAERRANTSESGMAEAERQLAREQRITVELKTALEAARGQNEEIRRRLLNLGWSRPRVSDSDQPVSQGDWRQWLRRR